MRSCATYARPSASAGSFEAPPGDDPKREIAQTATRSRSRWSSRWRPVYRQVWVVDTRAGLERPQQAHAPADTHQQIDAILAFTRCIRGRGFSRFARPDRQRLGRHEMHAQAGIDRHQPAIAQAAHSRVSVTHGPITRADVARFIAGG